MGQRWQWVRVVGYLAVGATAAQAQVAVTTSGGPAGTAAAWTARVVHAAGQPVPGPGALAGPGFDVFAGPVDIGGPPVKNAPYTAEAVTEVVQPLADGNRIVRRSTGQVARDSSGRTRREQGLAVIGSLVGGDDASGQVTIFDPAEGMTLILDPKSRTASKIVLPPLPAPLPAAPDAAGVAVGAEDRLFQIRVAGPGPGTAPGGAPHVMLFANRIEMQANPEEESLGTQLIEGVLAEGTRTTMTIPAGTIGNEREIAIVSERWYSPELQVLVSSRHTDPRVGETTYRLTNIVRAEPSPALFEVPSDYTIRDGGAQQRIVIRRGEPAR